jgi:phosphatidylinositol-3-phosphatase
VYPLAVKTVANQLEEKHLTWRGYMEGMEHGYKTKDGYMEDADGNCEHPPINQRDISQKATPGHQYAARHNPFVYFHSIIDDPSRCANDTSLEKLRTDLSRSDTTPNLAFITPNLCNDGHDNPCKGASPGEKDGLAAAVDFSRNGCPES